MSKLPTFRIASDKQITGIMHQVLGMVSQGVKAGPVVITLGRESKSRAQEAKYHAMLADIHRCAFRGSTERGVKALMVNQFARSMESMGTPLRHPGERIWDYRLEEWVSIRPSTTDFLKKEGIEFIEFLYAEGCEMRVTWSEPALAVYAEYARQAA
ncbi:MAG: hypothetical protein V7677_10330 [Motiliproteus sp.]